MRIIAGEFKGRKLLPPEGDVTRPVTDRVKQSLFDILAPEIQGENVYDCFAVPGSIGLESISRGAAHVTFFEADRGATVRLRQNIAALGVTDRSTVVAGDLFRWFNATGSSSGRVGLVFLDPPYRFLRERADDLRHLAMTLAKQHLADDGTLVFRHDARDALDLPPLVPVDRREYGGMVLEFLRAVEQSPAPT